MKITELLQSCDTLFPNEFSFEEKLLWCDELGALLTREHSKNQKIISAEHKNGEYMLPKGTELCDIDRIIIGGALVKKSDAPRHNIYFAHSNGKTFVRGKNMSSGVKFLARCNYERIRNVYLSGEKMSIEKNKVTLKNCPFKIGDVLLFEFGDERFEVVVGDIKSASPDLTEMTVDKDTLPQGEVCGDIKRKITDETVCSSPFDVMYYDFINAKICFYQRDYDSYNRHMAVFNSRLEDYDRYIVKNTPLLCDTRVTNWWN